MIGNSILSCFFGFIILISVIESRPLQFDNQKADKPPLDPPRQRPPPANVDAPEQNQSPPASRPVQMPPLQRVN